MRKLNILLIMFFVVQFATAQNNSEIVYNTEKSKTSSSIVMSDEDIAEYIKKEQKF